MQERKQELLKSEKEIVWENKRAEIDRIVDGLGKCIDEGIKDAVTAFCMHKFPTNASCEGHIDQEGEHGQSFPWIQIYAPAPDGWKESEEKKKEWIKENLKYQENIMRYLEKFYKNREVSNEVRLTFSKIGVYGGFRIQSVGADLMELLSFEEKKQKYKMYKKEMDDFSEFMKKEFFSL